VIYAFCAAEYCALISPIRQTPIDILRNIFSHCIPYETPEIIMLSLEAPMWLTQICRQWRDLSTVTPTFWSPPLPDSARATANSSTKEPNYYIPTVGAANILSRPAVTVAQVDDKATVDYTVFSCIILTNT
jgi:hypothetical protein